MKKIINLIILFYLTIASMLGQEYFDKQLDYEKHLELISGVIILDSAYLLTGGDQTPYTSESNRLLISINKEGNKMWEKSIYSGDDRIGLIRHIEKIDEDRSMIQGTDLFYDEENRSDLFLTKINHYNGDTLWTKYYGNDTLTESTGKMIRTTDGGFAIVGWVFKTDIYRTHFLLVKTDSLGNELFQEHYTIDSLRVNTGVSLVETEDKGFLLVGRHSDVSLNLLLFKVDSLGNEEWSMLHSAEGEIEVKSFWDIIKMPDGNFLLCGHQEHKIPGVGTHQALALKKINTEGEILWEQEYGENRTAVWLRAIRTTRNTYVMCGYETDHVSIDWQDLRHSYGVLSEVDSTGTLLWHRKYRSSPDDLNYGEKFYSVKETPDGGFIAVGRGYGNPEDSTYQNAWVIKTDSIGCLSPNCDDTTNVDVQYLYPPDAGDLFISPNPASLGVSVWAAGERVHRVNLYDLSGRKLLSKEFALAGLDEKVILEVASLGDGMYVLEVVTDVGRRLGKLVVAR